MIHSVYRRAAGAFLLAVACATATSAFSQTGTSDTNSTEILTISGKVDVAPPGSTAWIPGHTNEVLKVGDRIRTGKNSRATLRLSNRSILRVFELTTLEIQQAPRPGANAMLNVDSGTAYFFNRDRPLDTQFRTPSASGAIRGTEFNLAVADDGTMKLALLDGQVELNNSAGTAQLKSGEQAEVSKDKPPQKSALLDAVNVIQWTLYYPAILDVDELDLDGAAKQALADSLDAYRAGDLLQALAQYPENRAPASESEQVYRAALLLAVGEVDAAKTLLNQPMQGSRAAALAAALNEMIATVKGQSWTRSAPRALGTEFMAGSYAAQARHDLAQALELAVNAARLSPNSGFAQERLAEMQFSFGHTALALAALKSALQISPRNAQALALKGFALSAQSKMSEAELYFERAIAADGSLANGWLGRGLVRIHSGDVNAGRRDLETASALDPNRAFLRSYLGKAWSMDEPFQYTWNTQLALKELQRAMALDPNDPTAWLYSALLNDQRNCINDAIADLEHSEDLNGNRALYRSKFLLDQDQAVRSANLALIYEDAGLSDVATREATRSVEDNFANYSAHLFLADSYDALIDPKKSNVRYETPWENELLLANLLSPVNAGVLSGNISQQEYSSLFEADRLGAINQTQFFSRGAWLENGSQFGLFGDFAYSAEGYYYTDPGFRPNNAFDNYDYSLKVKQRLDAQDSVFLQAEQTHLASGDVNQYYYNNPAQPASPVQTQLTQTSKEDPNILLGYHRQWSPGQDTLVLYRNVQELYTLSDPVFPITFDEQVGGVNYPNSAAVNTSYQDQTELNSIEAEHIFQTDLQRVIVGLRYQTEGDQVENMLVNHYSLPAQPALDTTFWRTTAYAYYQLKLCDTVRLTAGGTYDKMRFPENIANPPISSQEEERERFSPKGGVDWTPDNNTRVRVAYTSSMAGIFNASSTLIEPSEIAGFNQAYRTLNSAATVPGAAFDTLGIGMDHKFPTRTYVNLEADLLHSRADQLLGVLTNLPPQIFLTPNAISSEEQHVDFREKDISINVDQLIGNELSVGLGYQLTAANISYDNLVLNAPANEANAHYKIRNEATLNQINLFANYYVRCGFFSSIQLNWWKQADVDFFPEEAGANFAQLNLFAGYRFPRRHVEIMLGLLNVTDRNYQLDPLTYYIDPAHTRTLEASLKFSF
jgi:Flp pilus assembly protein TadD